MKNNLVIVAFFIFTLNVSAHSSDDPIKDLKKNKQQLSVIQNDFEQLEQQQKRYENLLTQADFLQKNVLILRRQLASDYPHVSSNMSKYKLDYIEEVELSLASFRETLIQMKSAIEN